jgi:hypothetical protein
MNIQTCVRLVRASRILSRLPDSRQTDSGAKKRNTLRKFVQAHVALAWRGRISRGRFSYIPITRGRPPPLRVGGAQGWGCGENEAKVYNSAYTFQHAEFANGEREHAYGAQGPERVNKGLFIG